MAPRNVPLHVSSRVFTGHDRLMSTIDHELEKAEASCPVASCDVVLTGNERRGFRAAVALELDGGRCISQSVSSYDVARAIVQAFTACRVRAEASAEQ